MAQDQAAGRASNRAMITACVMLATLMQALDSTIANVALPYIQGSLSTTSDQINWVLTAYIVAAAIMTPATGFLEKLFGRKRLFITAVVGFVVTSVLCGLAGSLTQIVAFRLLQGVFGAPLVPLSQAVLLDEYPPEQQGQAMAIFGLGVMLGPILGPTLGGWLTNSYSSRWVFYVNVPFGILAAVGLFTFLGERHPPGGPSSTGSGSGALGISIGALQLMLDRGQQLDWFSSREIIFEAALSATALFIFLVHTLSAKDPFLAPSMFKDRNFVIGQVLIFIVGVVLFATLSLLSPYIQNLMNYPVLTTGLVLAPRGAGTMLAMFIVGRLIRFIDARLLILNGFVLTAWALYLTTGFTPAVSQWTIISTGLVQGLGIGFVFVPMSTVAFATLRPELRTQGTGFFNLMRNLGSSIGISLMSWLLVRNTAISHAGLVENITPYSDAVRRYAGTVDVATTKGRAGARRAHRRAGAGRRLHRRLQGDDDPRLARHPARVSVAQVRQRCRWPRGDGLNDAQPSQSGTLSSARSAS